MSETEKKEKKERKKGKKRKRVEKDENCWKRERDLGRARYDSLGHRL